MSTFTPEELTLICLYDPGTRLGPWKSCGT